MTELTVGALEIFCAAAERESFTEAAQALGLSPAAVSRSIARLEARLGAPLFVRTTRRVRLTSAGRSYFQQCSLALGQLREAGRELSGEQRELAGEIRLSLPVPYAHARLLPLLARFRAAHPRVAFHMQLSNRNVDFTADAVDLAVRARVPPESGL
ncbi:MAG: LysR family transcriptional regulator, partial [Beijerinckiaceae bacterium]